MKLLQIPTATLEQRIQEELEANPALEEGDETADLTDTLEQGDADPAYYERAWGGIIILLLFLLTMNIIAILLRRRFERRW